MKAIRITPLEQKRWEALAGHSRSPAAAYFSKELEWYTGESEVVIGVLLLDVIDDDFVAIVMGRDEGGRFRAIDVETSISSREAAREWLHRSMKWHIGTGKKFFEQGDPKEGIKLFTPVAPAEKLHPYFVRLNSDASFFPARSIIQEMMHHFVDVDGNFVEQFQTTGFDARLWELYLNAYFIEEQLFIDRTHQAPDFLLTKYGETVAVEAVIVGRKPSNPASMFRAASTVDDAEAILAATENLMPIRFGSPLFTKLTKKYWELPHVEGKPLIFAIADFHDDQSMLWSSTSLINYLYGVKHEFHHDESGKLIISPVLIAEHAHGDKRIPSGFFLQPESENVSAILFSTSGTISKFNRIGRQAGFKVANVRMFRHGTCHDHDPNASVPRMFYYEVNEESEETWGEGISMFHNPRAKQPVPQALFPSIAHHRYEDGQIVSALPDFHPYGSITMNIKIGGD